MSAGLIRLAARCARPVEGPPDALLLDRFRVGRDEAAFALLVARHGPTVLGVCRRVLGNTADAEDAFQAAFLVLLRKVAGLRDSDRLAAWLYGVAYRTALEARSQRARHWRRETSRVAATEPTLVPADPVEAAEVAAIVDREVYDLPEKYRLAVVLCDLDGRPRAEAAERLGVPEGTLSSRLAEGRKRLGERFARRGLALVIPAAMQIVPDRLVAATIRAAAGGSSRQVSLLADGVTRSMIAMKWKVGILVIALMGLVAVGVAGERPGIDQPNTPSAALNPAAPSAVVQEQGGDKKVADARPVVVKTVPAAGAEDVDPDQKDVRVTFSKDMADKSWSWATDLGFGADIEASGDIAYDKDKRTCILPCKLKPGTTYAVWLNSDRFQNFKDDAGKPAVPYLLVFRTKEKK